jgi:hypothetical protein
MATVEGVAGVPCVSHINGVVQYYLSVNGHLNAGVRPCSSQIINILSSVDADILFIMQVLLIKQVTTFWELAVLLHQPA